MNQVFILQRTDYRGLSTIGELVAPDGSVIGYTLEDVVRAWGVKDKGRTAIPATAGDSLYRMSVTRSQRFGRDMPIIYTESDKVTLRSSGIGFKGVRIHGGNTHLNTDGCVLVAKERIPDAELERLANATRGDIQAAWMIRGSKELAVTQMIQFMERNGDDCYLRVVNLRQEA